MLSFHLVLSGGLLLAGRLRVAMADLPIETGPQRLRRTISIGVPSVVGRLDDWKPALHQTDAALCTAKHIGRNCVVIATEANTPRPRRTVPTAPALLEATVIATS
ncbi:MAG: hypothetical protein ABI212_12410 [Burkholderiaceae bacterium]